MEKNRMTEIRYVRNSDKDFWYSLDRHLPEAQFQIKVDTKQGYILSVDDKPAGLLRYHLFWDSVPFCTLLYIGGAYQGNGYGKQLMEYWEKDMSLQGYGMVLTSTRADENAQHFYRRLGYRDCGGFVIDIPRYAQRMELFFRKETGWGLQEGKI